MSGNTELPEPLIQSCADCRKLSGFMLNVERLLSSELWALSTGDELKAAVGLWCRAWKQVPAGSLPDDDRVLASFSGAGARWPKVRAMALHGFVKCSDGRLYHPVLCEDAKRALVSHGKYLDRREKDAERLRKWRERQSGNAIETRFETAYGTQTERLETRRDETLSKGEGSKTESPQQPTESSKTANAPFSDYGFSGQVIRLTHRDLRAWRETYHAIPDIMAELRTLDAYYTAELSDEEKKRWFIRCSSALGKKHQSFMAETDRRNESRKSFTIGIG